MYYSGTLFTYTCIYTCIFPIFISETEQNDIHLAENEPMVTDKTTAEPTLTDQKENDSE